GRPHNGRSGNSRSRNGRSRNGRAGSGRLKATPSRAAIHGAGGTGCWRRDAGRGIGDDHDFATTPSPRMKTSSASPPDGLADVPDEDLMLLVARGLVQEPATELFARHNRDLFNFLAWLCGGNLAEAEDLAQ